jgi:hypothetical protein
MDARSVVESALQAMIAEDIQGHMRWVDDNVAVDSPATLPRTAKLHYLQEYSAVLAPGTGIRLSRYEVMYAGSPGQDGEWVSDDADLRGHERWEAVPNQPR